MQRTPSVDSFDSFPFNHDEHLIATFTTLELTPLKHLEVLGLTKCFRYLNESFHSQQSTQIKSDDLHVDFGFLNIFLTVNRSPLRPELT